MDKEQCPYNKGHMVPKMRMKWHLAKCPDYKNHVAAGKKVFRCQYNHCHVFLTRAACFRHEAGCAAKPVVKETEESSQIKEKEVQEPI